MTESCTWRWNDTDQSWDLLSGPEGCPTPPPPKPGGGENHELSVVCAEIPGANQTKNKGGECCGGDSC